MDEIQALATPDATLPEVDWQRFTSSQRRYLAYLARYDGPTDACSELGLSYNSVKAWRNSVPGFRCAEASVREAATNYQATLAKSILSSAAPLVAEKMAQRATSEPASDRQLVVAQRAGEQVLKAAGVVSDAQSFGDVERVDVLAMRLWRRKQQPDSS